ncbi:hypothetical protein CFN78_23120 [Amycolatopsis antarctica]|uniref:DUF4189 domain-containing protein n=1 Tax=Amycolatopsis antarctica TaxID=1854586 RepID=A0A263D0D2_9PSEU|nr:hypothetical protein [Amycolatopsis antarctica]OZM70815.1 hypothetical protein CFN78_23120 [Amycolatopsis antarctica]
MLKKLIATAAFAGASFAIMAPTASAAPAAPESNVSAAAAHFAGVYPNANAARKACNDGINQGRWRGCSYEFKQGQTLLWVV